jgi:hypothetical protein
MTRLQKAPFTARVQGARSGLGTASCGPDTLEQYRLFDSEYSFAYRLRLVAV